MENGQLQLQMHPSAKLTPLWKRTFDVSLSLFLLILLFPICLLIVIAILLESEGEVVYVSKRVGAGYKVFDLFKFRTMYEGAELQLFDLAKSRNRYIENNDATPAFIKIDNDPRITKVGKVLRMTSLDEIPQLLNVLKGDMSIVGNRPIPLYEAQILINENKLERFYAPGGITGIWQVSKRKKQAVTEAERITMDNSYVYKMNPVTDMKIMVKTVLVVLSSNNS